MAEISALALVILLLVAAIRQAVKFELATSPALESFSDSLPKKPMSTTVQGASKRVQGHRSYLDDVVI
jgi:hypothetical protein